MEKGVYSEKCLIVKSEVMSLKTAKTNKPGEDLNGNTPKLKRTTKKKRGRVSKRIKDTLVAPDGRVFYPCTFCNKVFPIRKTLNNHIKKCPEKNNSTSSDDGKSLKVEIKENIIVHDTEKQPVRLSPQSGAEAPEVSSPEIGDKTEATGNVYEEIDSKIPIEDEDNVKEAKNETKPSICLQCKCEFDTSMDLLRHTRRCNNYPKVVLPTSEVRKYFDMKDRSKCPICDKPMRATFKSTFIKHLTTHTNDMNFECPICRQKFRRKDHMKDHEKRHIVTKVD